MNIKTKLLLGISLWALCPFCKSASANSQIFYRIEQTLYAMDENGGHITRVSDKPLPPWLKGYPSWSPDGTRIILGGNHPAGQENDIFLVEVGSGKIKNLTDDLASNHSPVWSPDGKRIAYVRQTEEGPGGVGRIYVMNADGGGAFQLTDVESSEPAWSPDGRRIAFERHFQGHGHLYWVDIQTRAIEPLIENSSSILQIAWSPDGRYIGYIANPDPILNYQVYLFNVKRRMTKRVTGEGHNFRFAWSPYGSQIAVNSNRNNVVDIYVIDVESGVERATNTTGATVVGWGDFSLAVVTKNKQITTWSKIKRRTR